MYDVKSKVAEEFIDDGEIVATMEYARANRHNRALIEHILDKAEAAKGITHREAASCWNATFRPQRTDVRTGPQAQGEDIRQPNRHVRAALPLQLLHQRVHLLPLPCEEQDHAPQATLPKGDRNGSHRLARHGAQTVRSKRASTRSTPSNTFWRASAPSTTSSTKTELSAA